MNALRAGIRVLRALMLLTLLLAVIAGLPWGLWHFFGSPLPGRVPGYGEIKVWLDQAQLAPDRAALQVLDTAAWGYWALFVAQIAVQLPGVTADTVRALRSRGSLPTSVHSNLAGRLLFSVAISIIATRGTIGTASAASGSSSLAPAAHGIAADATTRSAVYTVVEGDSLWDIAEKQLDDPRRWREIYELNRHRVQLDGGALTDPDVIRPGWTFVLPAGRLATAYPPAHAVAPQQLEQSVPAAPAAPVSAAPSLVPRMTPPAHQDPSVVRHPVAVHLPTGGYVSLTLGASLAAALAAVSVRSRVNGRRRASREQHPEVARYGEPEASLLQAAAAIGYGRGAEADPYVDDHFDGGHPIPTALTALRGPIAVYVGSCHGRPIPLQAVAAGGLGLIGDGVYDTARALFASAVSAGGFLAGSAVYQVVTTTGDLQTLTGVKLSGHISDRLMACDTLEDALAAAVASSARCSGRRTLLLAAVDTATVLNGPTDGETEAVLLGCSDAATTADIGPAGTIVASGAAASALDGAEAYRLSLAEAGALMGHLLAALPTAEPEVIVPGFLDQAPRPIEQELLDSVAPEAIEAEVPEPARGEVAPPIPLQASGANPAAPEAALSVDILGPLQVRAGGRDVTALFRPLTAAILIQLALNPRGITRAALAADLWPEPDLEPDARAKRFKATLSHVRTALAEAHGAKADHIREARPARLLTFNPDLVAVDAWYFDELLVAGAPAAGQRQPQQAVALLEAIGLYRGSVAHGHEHAEPNRSTDEAWLIPHREVYFHKLIDAHTDAAALLRETDPDRAIDLLERAAELEPWNHALSEQIIEIQVEQGQRHAAARRLAILTEHLAHLGMRPSPNIAALVGVGDHVSP